MLLLALFIKKMSEKLFNVKYRRKFNFIILIIIIIIISSITVHINALNNCTSNISCMNGGICRNKACLCPDGWQGPDCQYCGGKVR